jgi:phytoene synthase
MNAEMRLIRRAGKTFYFATLWLPKQVGLDAARAYDFCRAIDDWADATPAPPDRESRLRQIATAVREMDESIDLVRPLLPLIARFPEIREPLAALVDACREDIPELQIVDEGDLERYAHGVAGNVGLIMYPILGGRSPLGRACAVDLGIAMQFTNIARDIFEDHTRGRVYLPQSWLAGVSRERYLDGVFPNSEVVVAAVRNILELAEDRYARGLTGLHYLAPQNRFGIEVAAQCYRAIGGRVLRKGSLSRSRAVIPMHSKILIATSVAFRQLRISRARSSVHGSNKYEHNVDSNSHLGPSTRAASRCDKGVN